MEKATAKQLVDELCEFLAEQFGYATVDPSCKIDQLVKDSLEFIDMVLDVQIKFSVTIPDSKFGELHTVADLGRVLSEVQR